MSDLLEYKDYQGTVEYSAADKLLYGCVVGIRGLISYHGKSLHELKKDFKEAIDFYLESCAEDGVEPQKAYKGKFNVRVSPELHKTLAIYSASHGQTLNSVVEEAIRKYVTE